ncbi:sugar transferase [Bdellovibrio sp. HCB2-146]|uniref:sugar transferase n=1 Tax=Bdellovibrio sp. HCB2-146 TaxID=3394362 RepID=UPI0039BD7A27
MNFAPVLLFVYNREWHTKQTISALLKNPEAVQTALYIYSDGPKTDADQQQITSLRKYLKELTGFKSITIVEREKNIGLAANIIDGVGTVVSRHRRVIVLEDDIITSTSFLKYMNASLDYFQNRPEVMHISGYMYPIDKNDLPNTFFLRLGTCWGWATWDRAWKYFEKNPVKQIGQLNKAEVSRFNLDDAYDFHDQLLLNYWGRINTWAIFWYHTIYTTGGFSLHPKYPLTQNIGFDSSGTHGTDTSKYDVELCEKLIFDFPTTISENQNARSLLSAYFKRTENRSLKITIKTWIKKRLILLDHFLRHKRVQNGLE